MLLQRRFSRRTAALLIIAAIAFVTATVPAWCVATGLWR